jgi:hypothetical protein
MSFEPLDYPGVPLESAGLLAGWVPALASRAPVVAVGSNRSPAVMAHKMAQAGVSVVVPMMRCRVSGIAVGHSAHVSLRGYIAAAPFAAEGVETSMVLSWLDQDQLTALDETEPNYRRLRLDSAQYPIRIGAGLRIEAYDIYDSVYGVLALDGAPLNLGSQADLYAALARVPVLADLVPWAQPEAAVVALTDAKTRDRVRELLAQAGLAVRSGFPPTTG